MIKAIFFLYIFLSMTVFGQDAQSVEKLIEADRIKASRDFIWTGPHAIVVNEETGVIAIPDRDSEFLLNRKDSGYKLITSKATEDNRFIDGYISLGAYQIGSSAGSISFKKNGKEFFYKGMPANNGGISFILKHPPHYVAFFVNEKGEPHAADTSGKIYDSAHTMALLKALDPEKFRQSRDRAEELGLEEQFLANKVLVWGRTYYSTPEILNIFWNRVVYGRTDQQILYDQSGYGYQINFMAQAPDEKANRGALVRVVDPEGKELVKQDITYASKIVPSYKRGQLFTSSTYVGFGGNIYFYVAGEAFTEVFRIRRTWGEPDFYAMAVNGYTEDGYGAYVKKVLKDLSKEDLRLLRNHLFALYGYVFKDAGLKSYFDKQVWYEPVPSATMDSIKLPAERQALLEMILAEEKKAE